MKGVSSCLGLVRDRLTPDSDSGLGAGRVGPEEHPSAPKERSSGEGVGVIKAAAGLRHPGEHAASPDERTSAGTDGQVQGPGPDAAAHGIPHVLGAAPFLLGDSVSRVPSGEARGSWVSHIGPRARGAFILLSRPSGGHALPKVHFAS